MLGLPLAGTCTLWCGDLVSVSLWFFWRLNRLFSPFFSRFEMEWYFCIFCISTYYREISIFHSYLQVFTPLLNAQNFCANSVSVVYFHFDMPWVRSAARYLGRYALRRAGSYVRKRVGAYVRRFRHRTVTRKYSGGLRHSAAFINRHYQKNVNTIH